jgi:probable F420-dependent oxidoreductase
LASARFWLGGSPRLPSLRALLSATDRLTVATGIVNVWQYEPADLAAEYSELAGEFGDRLLIGIGIGHPEATSDYKHPLATMRSFLDGLDAAPSPLPSHRRCLAALRPRMLDLRRPVRKEPSRTSCLSSTPGSLGSVYDPPSCWRPSSRA